MDAGRASFGILDSNKSNIVLWRVFGGFKKERGFLYNAQMCNKFAEISTIKFGHKISFSSSYTPRLYNFRSHSIRFFYARGFYALNLLLKNHFYVKAFLDSFRVVTAHEEWFPGFTAPVADIYFN